tara:strand:+ start:529 stop:1023 length:495 start_codon:yes stop_codon:yes gene_type:complete
MRPSYGHDSKPSGIIPIFIVAALAVVAGLHHWGDLKVSRMLPAYPSKVRTVDSIQTDHVKKLERKVASLTKRLQDAAPDDEDVDTERETKEQEVARFLDQKEHLLGEIAQFETKKQEVARFLDQRKHLLEKVAQLELEAGSEEYEPYSDKDMAGLAVLAEGGEI